MRGGNTVRAMVVVPASTPLGPMHGERLMPGPTQVLVIDRQPLFLAALDSLLSAPPLSAQVSVSRRSDLGLEIAQRGGIDVVFCDLNAEPITGRELADLLAREPVPVPVILLGDVDDELQLNAALPSSAAGLFTKDASLDELCAGVRAVLSGHRAISARLMGHLLEQLSHQQLPEPAKAGSQLSPTELAILAMVGQASSISAIAESRGISSKTVRNHLANIYRKLELHGRTEAMLWAARMGLTGS